MKIQEVYVMKQCIAVTEILRRIVVVDTKEAGTDGLENAIERVKEASLS